jgi:hypothetical protein
MGHEGGRHRPYETPTGAKLKVEIVEIVSIDEFHREHAG